MLATAPASRLLRFENFELDIRSGELRKGGVKLRLQGQPIQVLAALLNSPGNLVTREELRAQVWPAETFVDFDHSLHNAIARIRETLGDSAEKPRYIETLPRRGYRFIGTVERVGPSESVPALAVTSEPEARSSAPCETGRDPFRSQVWPVGGTHAGCEFLSGCTYILRPIQCARGAVDCGAAARQFFRRSWAGIFRRRNDR